MKEIFDNLINGNLKSAKNGAKRGTLDGLATFAEQALGWPSTVALAAAQFLKGEIPFQEYCDIEITSKN